MRRSILLLSLLLASSISPQNIDVADEHVPNVLRYSEATTHGPNEHDFVPLSPVRRQKRGVEEEIDPATATLPTDVEVESDTVDHKYYVVDTFVNEPSTLKKHWVNMEALLEKPNVVGNKSHPLLSKSYRRAVGSRLTFKFPFYGHKMSNLTIATGGFIYIGDQTHNWLAATQYIAPLMANFHTFMPDSNIIYADNGEMFVVEWRNVQLREDGKNEKPFSFQTILHKNGDIVFAYKDIPVDVNNISDANHPVKLGISDAYLFNHNTVDSTTPKRVIYEYHRIEIAAAKVKSNTVVVLKAEPTCIQFESCDSCTNSTLKHFNCQWCHAKKTHGGAFCTDEAGLHRRRQHWVEGNCHNRSKNLYCDSADDDEIYDEQDYEKSKDSATSSSGASSIASTVAPREVPETSRRRNEEAGTSFATLTLLVASLVCIVAWIAYAYYNPHTTSGQLLIKYRPSRWQMPSSHVRYSASVHM